MTELAHCIDEETGSERAVICPKKNKSARQGEGPQSLSLALVGQWTDRSAELGLRVRHSWARCGSAVIMRDNKPCQFPPLYMG